MSGTRKRERKRMSGKEYMYDTEEQLSERDEGIRCERGMVSESELAFSDHESQCNGTQQTGDEEQDEEVDWERDWDPTKTYIMTPYPRYMAESAFYTEEIVSWWVNMWLQVHTCSMYVHVLYVHVHTLYNCR